MKIKSIIISLCVLTFTASCIKDAANKSDELVPQVENTANVNIDGVDINFTQISTKGENNIMQYYLTANYKDAVYTSIVEVTKITETASYVEHMSTTRSLICSMVIKGDYIVSIDYNEEADDSWIGGVVTKGEFTQCLGNRYKQLREVIDSDGMAMLYCDVIGVLCPAAMATASAVRCIKDRNEE